MAKKLANRRASSVSLPSVILLRFWETSSPNVGSLETSNYPAAEPTDPMEREARLSVKGVEESLAVSVADGSVGVSRVKEVLSEMKAAPEAALSTGPTSLSKEDAEGPVVPGEMEAALRESNECARALGSALRRLGQAIQPGMEVILLDSASAPSSPGPSVWLYEEPNSRSLRIISPSVWIVDLLGMCRY